MATFHIGFNKLTEAGTMQIIEALVKHRSMKHLGIENTTVTSSKGGGDDQIQRVFETSMKVTSRKYVPRNRMLLGSASQIETRKKYD